MRLVHTFQPTKAGVCILSLVDEHHCDVKVKLILCDFTDILTSSDVVIEDFGVPRYLCYIKILFYFICISFALELN